MVAKTGDIVHVVYRIENTRLTARSIGQAIPSYGPQYAGSYVKKLDCFCFKQQTFAPHEVREMPVVFSCWIRGCPKTSIRSRSRIRFFEVPAGSTNSSTSSLESRK
jgi:hypothetical protein